MFERIVAAYRGADVVVIGAGGIGREIVRLASREAARVVVADFSAANLAEVAALEGNAERVTRQLDVRDPADVERFCGELRDSGGTPSFAFYTAGVLNIESFLETSVDAWRRAVDINLNGCFYCVRGLAELMAAQGRGSLLLLSSIAGIRARSGSRVNPVYNATKAALSAFVNGTAMQLRPKGVRINCISPGPTATSMMDLQPATVHAAVREITLDGRMNDPREVAELALFVAGHGRFTGEDVALGGGAGLGG